ncbi:VOC family protein [Luteibacter anthropi]|uniref:VOC family protein n=1 Tax=Luteibacter anthropi TaxID=564369 RepID=UPI0020328BCA|nr:VOC family protein [Luteibacter anthropi]URX61847.1 VOC family protein [Luteibacter anthropi]
MTLPCSHVLLWVSDLHQAVADFRQLGFRVDYATSPERAKHAHIWFTHGPVIELLTTPANAHWFKWPIELMAGRGSSARMLRWPRGGEGFCDVALQVDALDLRSTVEALRADGMPMGRAVRWERKRPDGQRIRFQFAYPRNDRLPFLVSAYDPPQHPAVADHANGATGLHRVHMSVRDTDEAAIRRLIGDDPGFALQPGAITAVRAIELTGLRLPCAAALSHGADIRPIPVTIPTGTTHVA